MKKDGKFRQHEAHSETPYKSSNNTEQQTKSIIHTTSDYALKKLFFSITDRNIN